MTLALAATGLFSVALGVWHLGVPRWFDFRGAIDPGAGVAVPLGSLRLGPYRRAIVRRDVLGLSWVMSNAASYVLVSAGVADLSASVWLHAPGGRILAAWIAGWWLVRAVSQLALGRRAVDGAAMAAFVAVGAVHLVAAVA